MDVANDPAIRVLVCASDGELQMDVPLGELEKALADPRAVVWVDINGARREVGEPILRDVFKFHPLTIDDCYNTLIDPPKVDDYSDYLFLILNNVEYDANARSLSTNELDLYVGRNYVVSVHRTPVHAVDDVRRRAEQRSPIINRGAAYVAHALFDVVVDDFQPVVESISEHLERIEELVIDRPERETLQDLLVLKRNALRLRRSISPQRDIATRFSRNEFDHIIPYDTMMYFRDVYDHTVRVYEAIESVRDLADSALNTYLSSVNNRTNEVMKTLAIVAVVFLPLTLIAGIYGTNFENVPEYRSRYGYITMWVAMFVVAGGLLAWFKYRRWF